MIWKTIEIPNVEFHSVVYGKDRFVAVGENFAFVSTDNGNSWQSTQVSMGVCDVTYGNETFVALARGGRASYTSTDGLNWLKHPQQPTITGWGIAFSGGNFFAGKGNLWSSPDGENWSTRQFIKGTDMSTIAQHGAASGVETVIISGCYHGGRDGALYSSDSGNTWKLSAPMPYEGCAQQTCFGDDKFVAHFRAGQSGSNNDSKMIVSEDFGRTWQAATNQPKLFLVRGVAYGDGKFIAVGAQQAGKQSNVMSPDGKDWRYEQMGENYYHGIAYGDSVFVAVGKTVISVGT